jgi:hypothetical protein
MNKQNWHLKKDGTNSKFWVSDIIPIIFSESIIGRRFCDIVEFIDPPIKFDPAIVIVDSETGPNGTTMTLS